MSICKKSAIFKRKRPQKIRNKFEKQLEHKKNHIKPQKPSFFIHAKYIEEKSYLNFKFMNNVG